MRKFLMWISGFLPCRFINDGKQDYLERYYLFTIFGIRFYLHQFLASDPGTAQHNHPWRWAASIVLAGSYYEENSYGLKTVKWFNWLTGDTFHRVILPRYNNPEGGFHRPTCWTLFFHKAKKEKRWGFLRRNGAWSIYFLDKSKANDDWWLTANVRGK